MLKDKVALITGSSRGIGKAIAIKLASEGCNVALNYRSDNSSIEELENELKKFNIKTIKVKADVSNFDESKQLIQSVINEFNRIDILVNNAGITKDNLILRMNEKEFDDVININLKGAFNCIKHVSRYMIKQEYGRIINISSIVGIIGNIGQANYSAAKAGLIGLTKTIAKELASKNITVNAVAPGFIKTDMTQKLPDNIKEKFLEHIPLKRFGEPEEVANLVSFLASDLSSYITGQVICIDGGLSM
ncbi:3-oxoacyl-[acyl-carrier-protein] reductase [Caldicellulosiruptoraceae bacterium PP1]